MGTGESTARLARTARDHGGIVVVRTFVEAHGGTVDAAWPQEGGSVFTIRLSLEA